MSQANLTVTLLQTLLLVILYGLTAFGPGFILGIIIGNFFGGREKESFMNAKEDQIRKAAQHNAQWDPTHERWQNKK